MKIKFICILFLQINLFSKKTYSQETSFQSYLYVAQVSMKR